MVDDASDSYFTSTTLFWSMIEIQPEHIRYLEVGDTFHETGYWQCLNLRIIEKPVYSSTECNWTWKAFNIDTYKVVDYLMTDEWSNYIYIYFSDDTYQRIFMNPSLFVDKR